MTKPHELPICDCCGERPGNIWSHGDIGIGTPLRTGFNMHYCDDCYNNRKTDCELIEAKVRKERIAKAKRSLERQMAEDNCYKQSGILPYTVDYYFNSERNFMTVESFEEYLDFKVPEPFRKRLDGQYCSRCNKHIVPIKHTRPVPEYVPFDAGEDAQEERRKAYRQWLREFRPMWRAKKDETEHPKFPEHLVEVTIDKLKEYPEYLEYRKNVCAWYDARKHYTFCSEDCREAACAEDPKIIRILG